jgi:predicted secreted hydrolase
MTPAAFWKSPVTKAQYPVEWRVGLPAQHAAFTIKPLLKDQELKLGAITYWEGAIEASGMRDGKPINGRGYLELTGYAGSFGKMLQR